MTVHVECPVGITAGARHKFQPGTGILIAWSIMGDPRTSVEVCTDCVKDVPEIKYPGEVVTCLHTTVI